MFNDATVIAFAGGHRSSKFSMSKIFSAPVAPRRNFICHQFKLTSGAQILRQQDTSVYFTSNVKVYEDVAGETKAFDLDEFVSSAVVAWDLCRAGPWKVDLALGTPDFGLLYNENFTLNTQPQISIAQDNFKYGTFKLALVKKPCKVVNARKSQMSRFD
ncbi:hypothetical protein FA15DRAFT_655500 [Coprinopsis marcescibilis]|uniref:Uncharacterized protein n=1 Tax=Coprinopsis marcescibilis TaxID=230819 RepID=A0A5C3KYR5_COPMA|nr:hypothetical protein FA15DRAFT_655500 [Coprinopsis marcescibilis]